MAPPRRRYPALRERLAAARRRAPRSPVLLSTRGAGLTFVLDPAVARSLLSEHELQQSQPSSEEDSNEDGGANGGMKNGCANLEKPTKPTRLLHHALTNANGDVWTRQRYCVGRAFAVDRATREAYARFAVDRAMELLREATDGRSKKRRRPLSLVRKWMDRNGGKSGMDVRIFSREVAIRTLSRIVLGERHGRGAIVIDALRNMVKDSLEPRRDEEHSRESESIVERLDGAVREAIEDIANTETGADKGKCPCLVQRLLQHEQSRDGTKEHRLTRDEVVGNAHSALLAGVQTISTSLAGALLHLAGRPDLQNELREGTLSGKQVVHETLRILPPVAGLPRAPKESDLQIMRTSKDGIATSCPVRKGDVMVIDLLAFSHAQESAAEESASASGNATMQDFPTLRFEPGSKRKTEAQPFGIGKRRCPAGILSVECISAVMEAIAREGYSWSFSNARDCVVGRNGTGGWYDAISYRPTLTYGAPLMIQIRRPPELVDIGKDST